MSTKTLTLEEALDYLLRADSFGRMERVFDLHPNSRNQDAPKVSLRNWYALLGDAWSTCDDVRAWRDVIKFALFGVSGPTRTVADMMNEDERAALAALPKTVTIFRGCSGKDTAGICWTLDRDIAARFPFLVRYRADDPVLITATVSRRKIVALKLDRDEQEVMTFDAKTISTGPLTKADAVRAQQHVDDFGAALSEKLKELGITPPPGID